MTEWNLERSLGALLDRLAEELLAMPEHEVAFTAREDGDAARSAAESVRRLIDLADADTDAPAPCAPGNRRSSRRQFLRPHGP